ncbi:MAG: sigma-70 family RNA polymerase sigma factor, partial [Caldilineaceae bacterium]
ETQWTDRYASGPSVRPMLLATNAPEEQVLRQDVQAYLVQALLTLPLTQRKVFILHDMEGWTVDEICRMLDLTEGNQRVLLHRARAKLRRLLAEYLTDHP